MSPVVHRLFSKDQKNAITTPYKFTEYESSDDAMIRKNSRKGFGSIPHGEGETRWMESAKCKDVNPEVFFPEGIEESRTTKTIDPDAEVICGSCSVSSECFNFAIKYDMIGVWGGTTDYTRKQLSKNTQKIHCPGCQGDDIFIEFDDTNICNSCGLSWT